MQNNTHETLWYAPLTAQFQQMEEPMPLRHFASIEAVLHLLMKMAPKADPRKAYLLFAEYQLIGTDHCDESDHILQCARYGLGYYRSQKAWTDALNLYCAPKYAAFRAFQIEEKDNAFLLNRTPNGFPYSYENREIEWARFWSQEAAEPTSFQYAEHGKYYYFRSGMQEEENLFSSVDLGSAHNSCTMPVPNAKGPREPIEITMEDLLQSAEEMAKICPGDYCYSVLKTNLLKECCGDTVLAAKDLRLNEVTNIVGMVGSGKSTLIQVLAYWCHCHGHKIAIVVDTVADVLHLWHYLFNLKVNCCPLIGRSERMKYINQVVSPEQTHLEQKFSQYLTPCCRIDGMDDTHEEALTFGKEPCYTLKKGGKFHLCPYFDQCSGTRMLRDCYTSSVVITTVAGFAASRVGWTRELFLELVLREFDLVIFDECDRVQKTLDQFFMPETKFNAYIQESSGDCGHFMKQSSSQREANAALQYYDEMQRNSVTVLSCIIKSLKNELGAWNKITMNDPFSALVLLDDLYKKKTAYQIPKAVYETLYALIDQSREQRFDENPWKEALQTACIFISPQLFDFFYLRGVERLGKQFPRPESDTARQIQDNRIKLILQLIYFDHFVEGLPAAYEACHETSYGQNELFNFLQSRFRQQQDLLPSSLCGNLFGLKKAEQDDISLFRQFAFGRSLMKDLPWLRTDTKGRPAGPHVMLLSGSSWAEGSYEYHVNRPVRYVLEAAPEKRRFLENTGFHESGFTCRVSGAPPESRMSELRTVTEKSARWIARELNRDAGKILVIVNSYDQAEQVQITLQTALIAEGCSAGVCRMVSDAVNLSNKSGTVRRGEVSRFAKMPEKVLIAPAMAIERGHNIVDETGHSALGAVFFLVRPMAFPDDIRQAMSKLNGYVEAHCKRNNDETAFAYNERVRKFASAQWKSLSQIKSFGLSELEEHEQRDIVATLFVLILQIFGRLARVTDPTKPAPQVYFMDGAFRARENKPGDFDCLNALGQYLEQLMQTPGNAEIAKTLYGPFYEAYKKGGLYSDGK